MAYQLISSVRARKLPIKKTIQATRVVRGKVETVKLSSQGKEYIVRLDHNKVKAGPTYPKITVRAIKDPKYVKHLEEIYKDRLPKPEVEEGKT